MSTLSNNGQRPPSASVGADKNYSIGTQVERQTTDNSPGAKITRTFGSVMSAVNNGAGELAGAIGATTIAGALGKTGEMFQGLSNAGTVTPTSFHGPSALRGGATGGTGMEMASAMTSTGRMGLTNTSFGAGGQSIPGISASGGLTGGTGVSTGGMTSATSGLTSGSSQADLMKATASMAEMSQSFNLQYLQLQEKMQAENRSFSTISNVLKTKHDAAKNSISNVR